MISKVPPLSSTSKGSWACESLGCTEQWAVFVGTQLRTRYGQWIAEGKGERTWEQALEAVFTSRLSVKIIQARAAGRLGC